MRSTACLTAVAVMNFTLLATLTSTPVQADTLTEVVSCLNDIKDAAEVLVMPDPIIKCGGMAGRVIDRGPIDLHPAGHTHDDRLYKLPHWWGCYYATTEYGYYPSACGWHMEGSP